MNSGFYTETDFDEPFQNSTSGYTPPMENENIYGDENERLNLANNTQEMMVLDQQYVLLPPIQTIAPHGYENQSNGQDNSVLIVLAIAGIALLVLLRE